MSTDTNTNKKESAFNFVRPQHYGIGIDHLSDDLKYLQSMAVPHRILNQLQSVGITTFEAILLIKKEEFSSNQLDFNDLRLVQDTIIEHYGGVEIQSVSEMEDREQMQPIKYHSTGIEKLDQMICPKHPGIRSQQITNFHGAPSSGKTLMLYQIACTLLLSEDKGSVIFIDCLNQFDGKRLLQMLTSIGSKQRVIDDDALRLLMERMKVYSVCSFTEISELIHDEEFESDLDTDRVSMILIDNLGHHSYDNELKMRFVDLSTISRTGKRLKYLVNKYNISAVTTSLSMTTNRFCSEFWIAGMPSTLYANWYKYIDVEIRLSLPTRHACVKPVLTKSRMHVTNQLDFKFLLEITNHIEGAVDEEEEE